MPYAVISGTPSYMGRLDDIMRFDCSGTPIELYLNSLLSYAENSEYTIKKVDSSVNTLTIRAYGSEIIDDSSTVVLSVQNDYITITPTPSGWFIKDRYPIDTGVALGETETTAYRGDRGKTAYDHSASPHAPSNAQKNSDITKAEIEAKLTGVISSHSHSGGAESDYINVKSYGAIGDGTTNDTTAINAAIAALVEGDTLYFPKGSYLVTPQLTAITEDNITVTCDNATIKTTNSTLYNIIFRIQADNCVVDGLIFDQWGDSALLPNAGAFQGCHTIFAQTFQSVTVRNCKFYTYGVTAVLTQPTDTYGTGIVTVENCEFNFKRKVSTYYDVSVVNADAMTVICRNNKVTSVNAGVGSAVWYAESAYELHGPNIIATNNEATYCINHILPVNWPMQYTTYDAAYRGSWILEGNFGHHLLRGINSWGAHTIANAVTRNFVIAENVFNLHASTDLIPVLGIAFSNGTIDASYIKHGKIVNNVISFTKESGLVEDDLLSGITTSSIYGGVGAISFNNSNSCEDILVSGNSIINFPGPAVNLICRQDHGTNQHKRIKIINNTIVNGDYSTYYDLAEKGLLILKDCTGIIIEDNEIIRNSEVTNATKTLLSIISGVTDVRFTNNKVTGQTTSGYRYGVDGTITSVTSDNTILRWYGALKGNADVYSETITKPDGTYNLGDRVLYDGASGISKRGYKCTTAGTVRTISAVTGTWGNATQIYVSPTTEFKVGDIVAFPGGQTSMVVHASGNYIYTGSNLVTWSGGQALTLKTPVFADII